ncbi:hypothetical protein ACRYCC_31805 [Actinomadura scrupuli]|uniref:hypothetical protein n=1 Tax=Actinomadura scrupuli TaxID=559629 RepID=UPI003D95933E
MRPTMRRAAEPRTYSKWCPARRDRIARSALTPTAVRVTSNSVVMATVRRARIE